MKKYTKLKKRYDTNNASPKVDVSYDFLNSVFLKDKKI